MIVSGAVVAVSGMAAADDNAVCATLEGFNDEEGIDSAAAGKFYDSNIRVHLEPACSRQIGSSVRTPVTDKSYNSWGPDAMVPRIYFVGHRMPLKISAWKLYCISGCLTS
jgi:hypothetical protein